MSIPLELRVLSGSFPARPTLHLGGWDYTDGDQIYGLTPNNRDALIRQLRLLNVDSPWATSAVIPSGRYDAAGRLVDPPPTAPFDRWTADWPDASGYYIFVNAADSFGGAGISENPRFRTAVGQWITFWTRHAGTRGITSSRLALLLVDEPHTPAQHNRIVEWARAIKAAEPGIRIWEDPNDADPAQANPASMDAADILALKRSLIARHGAAFVDFYRRRAAKGQELGVYGTDGPVRLLDPYSYYRLQAWVCADLGAKSSSFWSFSDDGGGHSWNEYATGRNVYSPWFLSRDRVTTSKHSEAIREGVEDFEYLTLLRDRVAALQRSDPHRPGLAHAVDVLSTATKTVLQSPGADDERWTAGKDRSVAERVRLSIADAIESLREAARPPAHDP